MRYEVGVIPFDITELRDCSKGEERVYVLKFTYYPGVHEFWDASAALSNAADELSREHHTLLYDEDPFDGIESLPHGEPHQYAIEIRATRHKTWEQVLDERSSEKGAKVVSLKAAGSKKQR